MEEFEFSSLFTFRIPLSLFLFVFKYKVDWKIRGTSVSKRVLVQKLSYENVFDLRENEPRRQFLTQTAKNNLKMTYPVLRVSL